MIVTKGKGMEEMPNYGSYHLHELHRALTEIDESARPEEARIIREYIAQGGYAYPQESVHEAVNFVNGVYKWSLVSIIVLLLLLNLAALVVQQLPLALIPIAVQGTMLFMIFSNHKHARRLIKIWSLLQIVSGAFGFLSLSYGSGMDLLRGVDHLFSLTVGMIFFSLADRNVRLVPLGGGVAEQSASQ